MSTVTVTTLSGETSVVTINQGQQGPAGAGLSIVNPGDNRVLTNDGSATGVVSESNLTFDGSILAISGTPVSISGHSHTSSDISDFNEAVDDRIGGASGLFVAGTGINLSYNDGSNQFTISTTGLQPSGSYSPLFDQNLNTTDTVQFSGVKIGTSSQVWSITRNAGSEALEFKHFNSINPKLQISAGGGLIFSDNTVQTTSALPLAHNNYIICNNGDSLAAKYAAAKLLTPGGNSLSATNRATLIVMPGNYTLSAELDIDTDYVDIFGLGSMKLDRGCLTAVNITNNTISLNTSTNDIRIKGISVGNQQFKIGTYGNILGIIEDCIGGDNSFGSINTGTTMGSTFVNCVGGDDSFGYSAAGKYINCIGGASCFGEDAGGYFKNCIGQNSCFGGGSGGNANGDFINCVAGEASFGGIGGSSGYFIDCVGGSYSWGGSLTGEILKCILTSGTFSTPTGSGKIRLCIDGNYDVINADAP